MKFIAITECPQGQRPGEIFDAPEAMGDILVLVGAAKRAEPDEPAADLPKKDTKGKYRRRDLVAEHKALTADDGA